MTQKQIPQLQRDALLSESLEEVIYYTQLRYFDALKGWGGGHLRKSSMENCQ